MVVMWWFHCDAERPPSLCCCFFFCFPPFLFFVGRLHRDEGEVKQSSQSVESKEECDDFDYMMREIDREFNTHADENAPPTTPLTPLHGKPHGLPARERMWSAWGMQKNKANNIPSEVIIPWELHTTTPPHHSVNTEKNTAPFFSCTWKNTACK